ncbi:MAG TPA: hypothetical protein VGJ39_16015 [Vicinamibacterales bacterium]|jgi:hypothetical protein
MSAKSNRVKFTALLVACFVLLTVAGAIAQTDAETKDPVTGKWGIDGRTTMDLKFDGKSTVSGATIWREGNRYEHRAAIKTGTFDAKTGVLKLEGEGKKPDGLVVSYVIEGKIVKDTVTGTFKFGVDSGQFTFKKQ